jgi:hypothetical protein
MTNKAGVFSASLLTPQRKIHRMKEFSARQRALGRKLPSGTGIALKTAVTSAYESSGEHASVFRYL